jgi:hypothetical protein
MEEGKMYLSRGRRVRDTRIQYAATSQFTCWTETPSTANYIPVATHLYIHHAGDVEHHHVTLSHST